MQPSSLITQQGKQEQKKEDYIWTALLLKLCAVHDPSNLDTDATITVQV